ncbi:MAG: FHA domain-containing protein [Gammaproteobacteria bacterium]|nr:FHA domain-containing protein [Gammaproteobacteria bacterium]
MAKLTLAFKDKKLKIFPILGAELIVGRDPDCAIHIDSLAVQPRHARIFADGAYYCVEGLHSEEPVLVNHKPLSAPANLQDGDLIQVGKHTLSFSSEPAKEGVQANHVPTTRPSTGWLQIMSGSHLGRTIRLDRSMTRLGKTGKESAMISRRDDGYHITHLEGDAPPQVNGVSIGDSSHTLRDGDRVHIGHLELHFYTDGGTPAAAETETMHEEQRRFTRIPFDAAAVLAKDGKEWPCELIDLSLKGALIGQPDNWNGHANEDYRLTLTLDDDVRIQMDVSVAHIGNRHVGLVCKDIDLDSITHLRRLVELNLGDATLLERELMALG